MRVAAFRRCLTGCERNNLLAVFVPDGNWNAGPGEAMVTFTLTARKPKAFRDDLRERVRWQMAGGR